MKKYEDQLQMVVNGTTELAVFSSMVSPAVATVLRNLERDFKYNKNRQPTWKPMSRTSAQINEAIQEAHDQAMWSVMCTSFAEMTIIHDTLDHYSKLYKRYEMKLLNKEAYLVDFYCRASTLTRKVRWWETSMGKYLPTETRVIEFCLRLWIDDHRYFNVPLLVIDKFPFRDTYVWEKISRGLGLPKDVAPNDHFYYFGKIDHEFREQYFKYRGGCCCKHAN